MLFNTTLLKKGYKKRDAWQTSLLLNFIKIQKVGRFNYINVIKKRKVTKKRGIDGYLFLQPAQFSKNVV